jgi:hypothetical protein
MQAGAWNLTEPLSNLLLRKHKGKSQLGRPRSRWEDNFKIDVKDMEYEDV